MENKQTAVDWLRENLESFGDPTHLSLTWETLDELIEEAKQMEKEQMRTCASFWRGRENQIEKPIFEQYYNETYQNEKKD